MLDLTFDPLFKAFMLSDNTKHYKAELFSLITGIPEELFLDAKYTSEELKVNHENAKTLKTDVIIKFNKVVISLEMNAEKKSWIMNRNLVYVSKLKGEELEKSKSYQDLSLVMQINFNKFHISNDPNIIQRYLLINMQNNDILTKDFIIYNIDLLNLKKECYNLNVERLRKLLSIFTNKENNISGDRNMNEAILEIERLKRERDIIGLYDADVVAEIERQSDIDEAIDKAKERFEKEKNKAIKKATEKAIQEVAKNMLKNNIKIDDIVKMTGLSIEEIEKLKDSNI